MIFDLEIIKIGRVYGLGWYPVSYEQFLLCGEYTRYLYNRFNPVQIKQRNSQKNTDISKDINKFSGGTITLAEEKNCY